MSKVVVGMSGGVDSAVSAFLLKEKGYDVVGVTLRTWESQDGRQSRCCEIDDARRVAWKLGIPYYTLNCLGDFRKYVTEPFVDEYMCGRTPNPCIECNRHVKWERMLYFAKVVGAEYVATGHYASVVQLENGRYSVRQALHTQKDQTYMLYRLTQEQLAATLMPLGDYTKAQVRKIAAQAELSVAGKADSQEICFVTEGKYADYIAEHAGKAGNVLPGKGDFVDEDGRILGKHQGIIHYTVGQRKGLGLALGYPAYVKEICAEKNQVVIGTEDALYRNTLVCGKVNFMSIPQLQPGEKISCNAKIRYHHAPQSAVLEGLNGEAVRVLFVEPVRAATPGQSAVFYDEAGCVIGGGMILNSYNTYLQSRK